MPNKTHKAEQDIPRTMEPSLVPKLMLLEALTTSTQEVGLIKTPFLKESTLRALKSCNQERAKVGLKPRCSDSKSYVFLCPYIFCPMHFLET